MYNSLFKFLKIRCPRRMKRRVRVLTAIFFVVDQVFHVSNVYDSLTLTSIFFVCSWCLYFNKIAPIQCSWVLFSEE